MKFPRPLRIKQYGFFIDEKAPQAIQEYKPSRDPTPIMDPGQAHPVAIKFNERRVHRH